MANLPIVDGKRIYELQTIAAKSIKADALFVLSQDNLTRAVSLKTLREAFIADIDNPSEDTYYNSTQVDDMFKTFYMRFNDLISQFQGLQQRVNAFDDTIKTINVELSNRITALDQNINDRITNVVNQLTQADNEIRNNLNKAVTDITNRITTEVSSINTRITNVDNRITTEVGSINTRITNVVNQLTQADRDLDTKITNWILVGYDAPTPETCPSGRTYLQLFN